MDMLNKSAQKKLLHFYLDKNLSGNLAYYINIRESLSEDDSKWKDTKIELTRHDLFLLAGWLMEELYYSGKIDEDAD